MAFLFSLPCKIILIMIEFPHSKKESDADMTESPFVHLETDFQSDLKENPIPFSQYPRPQLRRNSYLCLNGLWDFRIVRKGEDFYNGKILVPFVPESPVSGVMAHINDEDTLIYSRNFTLEQDFVKETTLLHFGACDQYAKLFVNGIEAGENVGGYLPFSIDISPFLSIGENNITLYVSDPTHLHLPYGKQSKKRGGMWYTKISGIWQTVWLESLPADYIKNIKITPDLRGIDLEIIGGKEEKRLNFQGKSYTFTGGHFRLEVESPICWTPENPHLYDFSISCGDDEIHSYFGLRTVTSELMGGRPCLCLNGRPYFFHGLLDQGYFSDGIFLPASERGYSEDIAKSKELGFNMLRKHIKLEPDIFYYYCDKYGMAVFQDMINSGKYSFFIDTALPTLFLKRGISHRATEERRREFEKTCKGIIDCLYNHPSVMYYTIFNEGWGQYDADENYTLMKAWDKTRIFDTTSGWFTETKSDVESIHIYFKPVKLKNATRRPAVLSEFGGYSCRIEGHCFNLKDNYGYKLFKTAEALENALISLYEKEIFPAIDNGLCGAVLTQLSDVEDETNGLLTYDRRVTKVDKDRFKAMSEELFNRFEKAVNP